MTQYYIMELQKYVDGSYGDIKHIAYDEDPTKARLKGESKFYEILSAAAISEIPVHAAIMFTSEGVPIMNQRYVHAVPQVEPETTDESGEEETTPDEETEPTTE